MPQTRVADFRSAKPKAFETGKALEMFQPLVCNATLEWVDAQFQFSNRIQPFHFLRSSSVGERNDALNSMPGTLSKSYLPNSTRHQRGPRCS